MNGFMFCLSDLLVPAVSAFAELGSRQGGMMVGGWWWGMNSQWFLAILSSSLIIGGIFLIMERRE